MHTLIGDHAVTRRRDQFSQALHLQRLASKRQVAARSIASRMH
jgi:hypothetical protein